MDNEQTGAAVGPPLKRVVRAHSLRDTVLLPEGGKTQTDVWVTPQWLFDALDKEFGFTLDPCSDGKNQKCLKHYTSQENGLLRDWGTETVFMNPPYSE